jgi:hypothetical protein
MKRLFWLVGVDDIDQNITYACDPIPGTPKMHSVCAMNQYDVTTLMIKNLACFCCFCMVREWFACLYVQWIREWKPKTLKLIDTRFAQSIMEEEDVHWDYGEDGNALATCLEIGDNFAVNAIANNDEGQEFWIIKCLRPFHKIKNDLIDAQGSSYEVGDDIVIGTYYQKWGIVDDSYVLLEISHIVFIYSHLVWAIKFPVFPKHHRVNGNDPIYELPTYAKDGIRSVLAILDVDD